MKKSEVKDFVEVSEELEHLQEKLSNIISNLEIGELKEALITAIFFSLLIAFLCSSFLKLKEDTILDGKGLVMSLRPLGVYSLYRPVRVGCSRKGHFLQVQICERAGYHKLRYIKGQGNLLFRSNVNGI